MIDWVRAEFLVEPFSEGQPGPHVAAAVAAFTERGLPVDIGAFGNAVTGPRGEIIAALGDAMTAALEAGASRFTLNLGTP